MVSSPCGTSALLGVTLWGMTLLSAACGPEVRSQRVPPGAARPAVAGPTAATVEMNYAQIVRRARHHAAERRYAAAFGLLLRCLEEPDNHRSTGRELCLYVGQRMVDRAVHYYRVQGRYLDDLRDFGRYPKGVDKYGNDKTFLFRRARRLAESIGDNPSFLRLTRLTGGALTTEAQRRMHATQAQVRAMGLHQARDPDRGPVRTYRYSRHLQKLFPRSKYAPEARYWLLEERRELRLVKGGKIYPWYALQRLRDLEGYLQQHRQGLGQKRFVLRASWELAPVYFDLWLMSRPAFQRTQDYRDYLKVGGVAVDKAAGQRYRQAALRLYRTCFASLPDLVSSYRPSADARPDLRSARVQYKQLGQPLPPPHTFPTTLFPPG
jgi:hypothetical protein